MEEKKLTDEKTLEFDDDVVDLLVEFDEMEFAPTTACPDPEEYASDWRERLFCAIKRVQEELECEKHNHGVTKEFYNNSVANSEKIFAEQKAEIATLKSELRKECEEHEEFTKKAKEEIERLTEILNYFQKSSDYHEGNQKELEAKNAELQKQVNDWVRVHDGQLSAMQVLTIKNKNLQKQVDELKKDLFNAIELLKEGDELAEINNQIITEIHEQAVKDTAKAISTGLLDFVNCWFEGVENNDFEVEFNRILKKFAKKYGVEVE